MLRIMNQRITVVVVALVVLIAPGLSVTAADKTKPQAVPSAPVPAPIFTAKKIFISNASGETDFSPRRYSGLPGRTYNQFYAALKAWGRYEIVLDPADAQLVFELRLTAPTVGSGRDSLPRPEFHLVIQDLKTRVALWTFTEYLDSRYDNNESFDRAMAKLVEDVQKLAVPPAARAVESR